MKTGWIKLHRTLLDHWIFDSPRYLKWWLWLLLNAEPVQRRVMVRGQLITLKPGQLIASLRSLRDSWVNLDSMRRGRLSPSLETVRRFLLLLRREGMIDYDATTMSAGTIITIVNSHRYQGVAAATATPKAETTQATEPKAAAPTDNANYIDYRELIRQYFAPEKQFSLDGLCKNLGVTMPQLREMAEVTVAEWVQNLVTHPTMKEASQHLTNTLRIKAEELRRRERAQQLHLLKVEKITGGETRQQSSDRMRRNALDALNGIDLSATDNNQFV